MTKRQSNLGASVTARLLNRTRVSGEDYQAILTSFCIERFLHRMGTSERRDRFVLKGAMLLRLFSDQPYRATRDLDLLRRGDGSPAAIREDMELICSMDVEPDGVEFAAGAMELRSLRADEEYIGTRVNLPVRCGTARLVLQVDLGLGDDVWPVPALSAFPTLLDLPAPEILVYPLEAVIAEKLEAMIVLGERNSRIKDYFDIQHLSRKFEFDRRRLVEAARRTFARRGTRIPADDPVGLTSTYWQSPNRPPQVRAFAKRAGLNVGDDPGSELLAVLRPFLLPLLADLRQEEPTPSTWPPGGPWR